MKLNLKKVSALGLLSCVALMSKAQIAPKYSNEFLAIGVGAKAMAMAGASVANVNDVTAGYWNPAGLLDITSDVQVGLMHSSYFAGISKFDYGAVAMPIDKTSVAGFSVVRLGIDDIPDTSELVDANGNINFDRVRSFAAADYSFIFSYARRNMNIDGLSYGGNAKIIYRNVGEFAKAYGFGIDAAVKYNKENLTFALMARDVTSTFNAWSFNVDKLKDVYTKTGNAIPQNGLELTLPKFIFGTAYSTIIKEKFSVLAEVNLDLTTDGKRNVPIKTNFVSIDPHIGFEIGYDKLVFLRAGLGNIQKVKNLNNSESTLFQPNIGAGVKFNRLEIDYAYTNIGSVSDVPFSNVFSLKLDLYKSK